MQARADVFGEGNRFGVAEDLDGLAAGVDDEAAVGAAGEMQFQFAFRAGVEDSIEVA